jgi:hypothetical protein
VFWTPAGDTPSLSVGAPVAFNSVPAR